jgi:hypothetical protein
VRREALKRRGEEWGGEMRSEYKEKRFIRSME